jgi:hypothetical protein
MIHQHPWSSLSCRHEECLDIREEDLGICTALDRHRSHDPIERERPQDGDVFPCVERF